MSASDGADRGLRDTLQVLYFPRPLPGLVILEDRIDDPPSWMDIHLHRLPGIGDRLGGEGRTWPDLYL